MGYTVKKITVTAMVLLWVVMGMGCGKKGPPLAPLALIPPPPVHVSYQLTADQVMLQWELDPEFQKKSKGGDMGVEIYRAGRSLSEDACKGCPLPFEHLADVPATTLEYRESLERGFRYFYRLRTAQGANIVSEYSETVEFDFE
ncbi:MAG: hypothetical protein QM498_16270 [Desulfobacterium sp.]